MIKKQRGILLNIIAILLIMFLLLVGIVAIVYRVCVIPAYVIIPIGSIGLLCFVIGINDLIDERENNGTTIN
jgi:hypothetical protein